MRPPAIGYLHKGVSGTAQAWDETGIRSLARRFGYDLSKIVTFTDRVDDPVKRLLNTVESTDAEAVFIPSRKHLGDEIPAALIEACDVIEVDTEISHARTLPSVFDPPPASEGDTVGDRASRDRPAVTGRCGLPGGEGAAASPLT